VPVKIVMDDGREVEGVAESLLASEPVGRVVQLERLFFARIDGKNNLVTLYYSTK
jgi:hypothetical protein